jgi:hypothetical protein
LSASGKSFSKFPRAPSIYLCFLVGLFIIPALYYVRYPSKMMNVQKSTSDLSATASLNRATSLVDYHRIMLVNTPPVAGSNCAVSPEDYRRTMLVYTRNQVAAFIMSVMARRNTTSAACSVSNRSCGSGRLVPTLASVAEADSLTGSRENEQRRRPPRPS